jgi:FKBP-type peptidyl-prolyl cis-trans isomerase FkpA
MLRKIFTFLSLLVLAISCKEDVTDYGPIDKKIIEDYIAANSLTAQSTTSGLYYVISKPGGTSHPGIYSNVKANYKGYLTDGTVFDQTTGSPATFPLTGVIQGWREGLQLIGVNGKIKLLIPSALGYGSQVQADIPANSVLIFDIELIDIY